jgi:hypothetical protein
LTVTRNWLCLAGLCISMATAMPACAEGSLRLAGFGTVSAYRGDDPIATIKPGNRVKNGSLDGQWRWDGDSVLGLQLRADIQEQLEVVWQLQARDDLVRRYRPHTEWAYLGWRPHPEWTVRLGRQPLPVFLSSETTRVGYAQVAIRPMPAVYGLNSADPTDAVNLSWSGDGLGGQLSLDLAAGGNKVDLPRGRVSTKAATVAALRWRKDGLSLRLGAAGFRFDLIESTLAGQLASLSQPGSICSNCASVLPERARMHGVRGRLFTAGLIWEHGAWTLTAEAMRRGGDSVFSAEVSAWYAQLARRLGGVTPYAAIGESRFHEATLGLQAAPGASAAAVTALAQLDSNLQSPFDRRVLLAGLRWDIAEQMALKLQYDHWRATRDRSTPRSGEINLPALPAGSPGWDGRIGLLSLSLDFVF